MTRTILPESERLKVTIRDGYRCRICSQRGDDYDHAFPLANHGKRFKEEVLNKAVNINVLCRQCHTQVTYPVKPLEHYRRLFLMKLAMQRAFQDKDLTIEQVQKLYDILEERKAFVKSKYE